MGQDVASYFWGIYCGSTKIKVVVSDANGAILHMEKRKTLFPLMSHVQAALSGGGVVPSPFDSHGARRPGHKIVATGYGRAHIAFVDDTLTEIKAHFLGVSSQMQDVLPADQDYTIIDIGGQDSKIVIGSGAEVRHFVINRKCAAGTGAYIEELAHRLQIPLGNMSALERAHDKDLTLNSYCTVFAGQEVIRILMEGERVENLIYALYQSVVQRVFEMGAIKSPCIVFTGGVLAHHESLRLNFSKRLTAEQKAFLAPHAQFCGAIGASQYARRK